jgi:hypothetical protein
VLLKASRFIVANDDIEIGDRAGFGIDHLRSPFPHALSDIAAAPRFDVDQDGAGFFAARATSVNVSFPSKNGPKDIGLMDNGPGNAPLVIWRSRASPYGYCFGRLD